MVISVYPAIVAIAGVLLFVLSSNSKLSEIGRWMFIVGLLWLVYVMSGKSVKL